MDKLKSFYDRMPVAAQHVAVSAYGLLFQWQRYGFRSGVYADELRRHESWSAEQLDELVLALLRARAILAITQVPAYRHLAGRLGEIRTAATVEAILREFPILGKEHVRSAPDQFIPSGVRGRLITGTTSGTTGTPLKLFRTREGLRRNFDYFRRVRRWRGLSHWSRTATLMGRLVVPSDQTTPPFWRRSVLTNTLLLSSYHLGAATARAYALAIAEFRPLQIVCYPSSGAAVADAFLRLGMRMDGVKCVFTTAETVSDAQRRLMETAYGCPVADQYGASEWTVWISQCEQGTYHVHPEYGYLEVVDKHGAQITKGCGRAIATGFVNDAMVLMRYDTGDDVCLDGSRACGCGRHFRVVSRVEGRSDDTIHTPDGRLIGRLDPVFKGLASIVECQIVQTAPAALVARVVVDDTWTERAERNLAASIERRVGPHMTISVERVARIPRTAAGKFRAVVGLAAAATVPPAEESRSTTAITPL
jgi:phenylacetate-CoA ligase